MSETLTKDPTSKKIYETPTLTPIETHDTHFKEPETFFDGERVSFASKEKLHAMLEIGYLELECLMQGHTIHQLVRKLAEHKYQFSMHNAGETAAFRPFETARVQDILMRVDLHAFRWYSNG